MTQDLTPIAPRLPAKPQRDEKIRRKVRALAALGGPILADLRYRPALQSLARITVLIDRMYVTLKDRELVNDDGSAIGACDAFRRAVDSQASLLKSLGLMPTSVLPDERGGSLDAVFERIAKTKKAREQGNESRPSA